MSHRSKRSGSGTKARAQQIALRLFTAQGYEATSLREIAEALGITKASLYYHFKSKEEIVGSIVADRTREAQELLAWVQEQPEHPSLLRQAVMRWVESNATEKLRGVRFTNTNPLIMRAASEATAETIGRSLDTILGLLLGPAVSTTERLLARLAFFSLNMAASAAEGTPATDEAVVAAAQVLADTLIAKVEQHVS